MKITFAEIPEHGKSVRVKDEAWFPDQELERQGEARAQVFLERKGENRVLCRGSLQATVILQCDRCLADFPSVLDGDFSINLEWLQEDVPPPDHVCSAAEMDSVILAEPEFELFDILQEQVLVFLPLKRLCREDCRGLCQSCGENLNTRQCGCAPAPSSSPFSILASLKK